MKLFLYSFFTPSFSLYYAVWNLSQGLQVTSSSVGQTEANSAQNSSTEVEESSLGDENEKGITLGDALNQAKETSLASVEELHNLAGGADIKVPPDSSDLPFLNLVHFNFGYWKQSFMVPNFIFLH